MIPWIQVYSNLPQHKKTSRLAEELKISSAVVDPNMVAVGILIGLWTWAIQNAYDGDLSECSARTIANACQWKKKPETLVAALKKTGWLDADMRLHDWEEYAVLLIDQEENRKERTRERVRKHREKKLSGLTCAYCGSKATGYDHIIPVTKGGTDEEMNLVPCCPDCNREKNNRPLDVFLNTGRKVKRELVNENEKLMRFVTLDNGCYTMQSVTLRNAPTVPNLTKPDQLFSGGGDDARARASEEISDFAAGRDMDPSLYFGVTPEIHAEVEAFTDAAFSRFAKRPPTENDDAQAFMALYSSREDPGTGNWIMTIPRDNKDLLLYAFEAASNAGKPGDWRYINGVLSKLRQRGIHTLREAEDYDAGRTDDGF